MNRIQSYLIFSFLVFLPVVGFSQPRTYEEILKSKELRICYPPWIGKDTIANFPSPYMEMAKDFAKHKNLTAKTKEIIWSDQFKNASGNVAQGETYTPALFDNQTCDLYSSNISPLEWRKKLMDMNWIYVSTLTVVVRKEDQGKYKTVDDLKSKTVHVMPNSTYHNWLLEHQKTLKENEKMNIVEAPEGGTVALLLQKKADFIIYENQIALYAKKNISNDLSVAFTIGKPMESGWGFPKGSDQLKKEVLKYFENERSNPQSDVNTIYKRYFGLSLNDYEKLQYSIIGK